MLGNIQYISFREFKEKRSGVHYVFNPDHYIGIVIANTTLFYK
jgi:hypothetical protein